MGYLQTRHLYRAEVPLYCKNLSKHWIYPIGGNHRNEIVPRNPPKPEFHMNRVSISPTCDISLQSVGNPGCLYRAQIDKSGIFSKYLQFLQKLYFAIYNFLCYVSPFIFCLCYQMTDHGRDMAYANAVFACPAV